MGGGNCKKGGILEREGGGGGEVTEIVQNFQKCFLEKENVQFLEFRKQSDEHETQKTISLNKLNFKLFAL